MLTTTAVVAPAELTTASLRCGSPISQSKEPQKDANDPGVHALALLDRFERVTREGAPERVEGEELALLCVRRWRGTGEIKAARNGKGGDHS